MKAYESKRDLVYRVWLGFTQMMWYLQLSSQNAKKIKIAQNAVANLERCSKEERVGMYANFALLHLSLRGVSIKGLQDPSHY